MSTVTTTVLDAVPLDMEGIVALEATYLFIRGGGYRLCSLWGRGRGRESLLFSHYGDGGSGINFLWFVELSFQRRLKQVFDEFFE